MTPIQREEAYIKTQRYLMDAFLILEEVENDIDYKLNVETHIKRVFSLLEEEYRMITNVSTSINYALETLDCNVGGVV